MYNVHVRISPLTMQLLLYGGTCTSYSYKDNTNYNNLIIKIIIT